MGLDIFKYLLPSQQKKVEEELALLKANKLEADKVRFSEEEQKHISENDRNKLSQIHPIPRILIIRTIIRAEDFGIKLGVHMALRSYEEQAALYAKGRDANGNVIDKKEIVTNAPAGKSWHNYGLAVDIVMEKVESPKPIWTWDEFVDANKDGVNDWKQLGDIGKSFGLSWGGDFKPPAPVDVPHFQYHNGIANIEAALILYKQGGINAVWKVII